MSERRAMLTEAQVRKVERMLGQRKSDDEIALAVGLKRGTTLRAYLHVMDFGIETVSNSPVRRLRSLKKVSVA